MKFTEKILVAALIAGNIFASHVYAQDKPFVSIVSEDVKFSESVYPYDGGLFISNFGSEKNESARR